MQLSRSFVIRTGLSALVAAVLAASAPSSASAQEPPQEIRLSRAPGEIRIDGELGDPGWQGAAKVDTFYETNPGDNIPAPVPSVAYLSYDGRYLYAAFEFFEPDMKSLRAPFGDRDNVPSTTDYGGIIVDTRNNARTAVLLLANPRNIQYDANTDDASGEDSSLDLYWDSATRILADRWVLEMRVPFSSLRYDSADPQTWGILLYRNRPREFRTQMFNVKLPRGSSCFICHEAKITGLSGLPGGNHLVLAPYGTSKQTSRPEGLLGTPLEDGSVEWDGGIDAKWTPNADTAIDATINPDFSQIESDVAQISANERFALFVPERRPFFLEGLDLFATPIQAVYTRTITSPRWGARATGELAGTSYTLLVTEDRGGGSVILPGPEASDLAPQDFGSTVVIGRARRDLGSAFVSFLATAREIDGGGHNRVFGPDFRWQATPADVVRAQLLWSDSRTPERPELASEWTGRDLSSHAFFGTWSHSTSTWDWAAEYYDIGDEFRADVGFLPQVGVRDGFAVLGRSFFPEKGFFRRFRPFVRFRDVTDQDGDLVLRRIGPGFNFNAQWNSFFNLEHRTETQRIRDREFEYDYFAFELFMSPSLVINDLGFYGTFGEGVDVVGARPGEGATLNVTATVRPTDHLALRFDGSRRWLDVEREGGGLDVRLFTADVARLKATYTFSSRSFLRLIGERITFDGDGGAEDESFAGSALFAYKINWQTVLFLGYGDERAFSVETNQLERSGRELFLKVSYAFQR
ncbi:MAG TPA: DUF5916 domain-containing protein [Thermoanaerobaculia bacterium]